jgi:urease gamma subunit
MEIIETNIIKLKDKILKSKIKLNSFKIRLRSEDSDIVYADIEMDIKAQEKELVRLTNELNSEINKDKKEKLIYQKSLNKIKDSINEFSRVSRTNSKLKKHTQEIINVISVMEKYLSN